MFQVMVRAMRFRIAVTKASPRTPSGKALFSLASAIFDCFFVSCDELETSHPHFRI